MNLGTAFAIYSDMTNTANILKTSNGNSVVISSETDNRIKSVAWSDGAAMILAKSCTARDELVTYYRAWGLSVDTCDRKGLTVWA